MNMPVSSIELNADPQPARAHRVQPLPTPGAVLAQLPVGASLKAQVSRHRAAVEAVLTGQDERLLVVLGPCSLHDEDAALDYAQRLLALQAQVDDRLLLVMRAYLEKPRTTVGWKGLLHDPRRDGQGDLAEGIMRSRRLLLRLARLGLPLATEALSPLAMHYLEDLISWTAIGARTTESQTHREMASGLAMPVGFKNGTDGGIQVAINAMLSASSPHQHLDIDADGRIALRGTPGNPYTHLVLRGGRGLTNYDAVSIAQAGDQLRAHGLRPSILVDCSHDNACKDALRQPAIALDVAAQRRAGNRDILGVMLESFIEDGRQNDGPALCYGQSITDPCLGWEKTESLLLQLAQV